MMYYLAMGLIRGEGSGVRRIGTKAPTEIATSPAALPNTFMRGFTSCDQINSLSDKYA